ncbi:tetratricopeptide repeat protein [Shimia sp.]|uniref:tetratricopeptide repeat protein n=1 Tax=Shimia sp. TaxID=1954381 RepID=UPI00356730F9
MNKPEVRNKEDRRRLAEIVAVGRESGAPAAEQLVVEFLQNKPKSSEAFIVLSRILLKQGKLDDAVRACEKARQIEPMQVEPLNGLGLVFLRKKDHAAAEKCFAEAIALDASSRRAHHGILSIRYAAGEYDAAQKVADHILTLKPDDARAEEMKLRIHLKQGDREGAIALLKSVLLRNAKHDTACKAFLRLMRSEGREEEAYRFVEQDAKDHPEDLARARRLARIAFQSGRTEAAVVQYRHIIEEGSTRPDDRVLYISALIANRQLREAEALIATLGDRRVVTPVAGKLRGDIALAKGNPGEAVEQYRAACEAARVEPVAARAEARCKGVEERARLWSSHARKMIMARLKELRRKRRTTD